MAELANVRFLAGYRNPHLFDDALAGAIRNAGLVGSTLGQAFNADLGWPPAVVRAGVLHVIWNQHLTVDLAQPLTVSTVLAGGPRT